MTASNILSEAGMSQRPQFYSGRGAITCDLNDVHLSKIYELIDKHHGKSASKSFVNMVEEIPVMSATDFINCLYSLENSGWKYKKGKYGGGNGIDVQKNEDGTYNEMHGMVSIFAAMGSGGRNETDRIKWPFLSQHGKTPKKPMGGYYSW